MSDSFTHFGTMFSTFLSHYEITHVTTRSADVVRMTHTTVSSKQLVSLLE